MLNRLAEGLKVFKIVVQGFVIKLFWQGSTNLHSTSVLSRKATDPALQIFHHRPNCFRISTGYNTNSLLPQFPKGRVQTNPLKNRLTTSANFNPQRAGYNHNNFFPFFAINIYFNPQRAGYKLIERFNFIISTLCTTVNVFILEHTLKTNSKPAILSFKA
ncbi:hypothetical protein [Caldicellulosiruptor bescii]|nr:hypothetical protein [Caldicellulosiruptor bescii]